MNNFPVCHQSITRLIILLDWESDYLWSSGKVVIENTIMLGVIDFNLSFLLIQYFHR